jgi:hypothetical protein
MRGRASVYFRTRFPGYFRIVYFHPMPLQSRVDIDMFP